MDLTQYRSQIDAVDDEILTIFCRRMEISSAIAEYKKANHLPIYVPSREQEKLADIAAKANPHLAGYAQELFSLLFDLSKRYQQSVSLDQKNP